MKFSAIAVIALLAAIVVAVPAPIPGDIAVPGKPSDCPKFKHLCNDPRWKALMKQQCAHTCGH
ncbi:hypothetical protein CALCODRAFT_500749 [Calocera cornea HHB12733]|uniref:ShKT domain-containing protein n=1 Tax=Calocera cornea HHB12733 TaxID=1353952 RepID=A0A165DX09_9BASI|nr:hypothetical protein CALCODRAFT_500749 [Calocera cornea HHB12733]